MIKFILYYIPNYKYEYIQTIGVTKIDKELIDYYISQPWHKEEKCALIFVNHYIWKKRISKNLMLEIFEMLEPQKIDESKIDWSKRN